MFVITRRIMTSLALSKLRKRIPVENVRGKARKKVDRFDGLSEEEVQKYTLPDYLEDNLDMVFVGINPSLLSAHRGRYYASPGNHFYSLLYESGLTPRYVNCEEDYKLLQFGIGLTNIVTRPTRSSADLSRMEIKEGSKIIEEKLQLYKPKVAIFNGKCIYDVFANKTNKSSFNFGLQPERIGNTAIWVVPSSSARCANFPKMTDKLHFYFALKKYIQFLKNEITDVDVTEFFFEGKCKQFIPRTSKMWRRKNVSAFLQGGRVANKDTIHLDTSDENVEFVYSTEFLVKKVVEEKLSNENKSCENAQLDHADVNSYLNNEILSTKIDKLETNQENTDIKEVTDVQYNSKKEDKTILKVKSSIIKTQTRNHRKYKQIKDISPKSIYLRTSIKNNDSLDFVKLIKQKLSQKINNTEDNEEIEPKNKS